MLRHGSKTTLFLSLPLLFALSCGKSGEKDGRNGESQAPSDSTRNLLEDSKTAKITLARKSGMLAANEPVGNPESSLIGAFGPQFAWPIIPVHAILLPNGKIFNFGTDGKGEQGAGFNYDVWNPALGTGNDSHQWLPNRTATDIFCSATSILPETGDVLIPGGDTRNPVNYGINSTLVFNTGSQNLDRTAYMQFARWYPTAITLPNGQTMIHGGRDGNNLPVATPEVFNNGQWRSLWGATNAEITGDEEGRWFYPRNWVAPNGRVFGMSGDRMYFMDWQGDGAAQIVGRLPNKSRSHISTAVMYQPGKILQVGGSVFGDTQAEGSNQAITVDITSGNPVVQDLPNMAKRRVWANASVLPTGEVLITGGSAFENRLEDPARVAEIWNPETRQFRQLATALTPRLYHSISILLPDATVLIGGGGAPGPLNNLNGEIYYPPYLYQSNGTVAPRLTIGQMGDRFNYNANVNVPYIGQGRVRRVTLVRTGAVTHSFDAGQRFLELSFTQQNGAVEAVMPSSPNLAPPGYYMLFLINEAGVPSVSKIINISGQAVAQRDPMKLNVGDIFTVSSRATNKCLDVAGQDWADGAVIQQYECNNTAAQKFRLIQNQNGGLSLANLNSGKCLDVANSGVANGSKLQQWDCQGSANQNLSFDPQADGSFHIRFSHSNRCLDLPNGSQANSLQLQQWDCTGSTQQKWILTK